METSAERLAREYGELPYPSWPILKSHPDTLCVLGRLFGMQPAPIEGCRILELGCASGGNLLPMAAGLPGSQCVGVDLAQQQIAEARRRAAALGLSNVEFIAADLSTLDPTPLGRFDYIICHGVFSWVRPEVQDRILSLARELSAEQAVIYISYNAYPGWHLLGMLRGILLRETAQLTSPRDKVRRAREVLALLEEARAIPHNPVAEALAPQLESLRHKADSYLLHEYLAECNEAFYFEDFVRRAESFGLRYLANAAPQTMTPSNFPAPIVAAVAQAGDELGAQQRLDLALGRGFNSTLLCRSEVAVSRDLQPEVVMGMAFDAALTPDPGEGDVHDPSPLAVRTPAGEGAWVSGADLRTALSILNAAQPRGLPFGELMEEVLGRVADAGGPGAEQRTLDLASHLARLYFAAVVGMSSYVPPIMGTPGASEARPRASALARLQASEGDWATNQWHQRVPLSEAQRRLLSALDGSRTVEELSALFGEVPAREGLQFFARAALLVA